MIKNGTQLISIDYLKSLRDQKEPNEAIEELAQILTHKRDDFQVVAAQEISKFRNRIAVDHLRNWLFQRESILRKDRFPLIRQAQLSLTKCIQQDDIAWILEYYFKKHGMHERFPLFDFVAFSLYFFPTPESEQQIANDCESENEEDSRASIIILGRVPFPNRDNILKKLQSVASFHNQDYIQLYLDHKPFKDQNYLAILNYWRG